LRDRHAAANITVDPSPGELNRIHLPFPRPRMSTNKTFTIAIGSDHAGFRYKEAIKAMLLAEGHTVRDFGTHSDASCDYPDFIRPVAQAVARGEYQRGIVLGGSGNGEAIVANRVPGVRCGLCWNEQVAIWNRSHNDANCLSLGERTVSEEDALKIVRVWLATEFEGGRHLPRVRKIDA
jgi:ribose 5-phosphate isomerase B